MQIEESESTISFLELHTCSFRLKEEIFEKVMLCIKFDRS